MGPQEIVAAMMQHDRFSQWLGVEVLEQNPMLPESYWVEWGRPALKPDASLDQLLYAENAEQKTLLKARTHFMELETAMRPEMPARRPETRRREEL